MTMQTAAMLYLAIIAEIRKRNRGMGLGFYPRLDVAQLALLVPMAR